MTGAIRVSEARPAEATATAVGAVFLVSAFPSDERTAAGKTLGLAKERFAHARLISVFLPGVLLPADLSSPKGPGDQSVSSFVEATQVCVATPSAPNA